MGMAAIAVAVTMAAGAFAGPGAPVALAAASTTPAGVITHAAPGDTQLSGWCDKKKNRDNPSCFGQYGLPQDSTGPGYVLSAPGEAMAPTGPGYVLSAPGQPMAPVGQGYVMSAPGEPLGVVGGG